MVCEKWSTAVCEASGKHPESIRKASGKHPESIRILTDNGIVLGSVTAVVLNAVFHLAPAKAVKQVEKKQLAS